MNLLTFDPESRDQTIAQESIPLIEFCAASVDVSSIGAVSE